MLHHERLGRSDVLMDVDADPYDPFVDPRSTGVPLERERPTALAQGVSRKGRLVRTGQNTSSGNVSTVVSQREAKPPLCSAGLRSVKPVHRIVREHCPNARSDS